MDIIFKIVKSREILEKQWQFLVKRGVNNFDSYKGFFRSLIIITGIFLIFYFFSPADYLIALKAVGGMMIVLGWITAILVLVFICFRNIRNNWRLKNLLNSFCLTQLSYEVQINNESIKIISDQNVTEFRWTEFTNFVIHDNTIYVYNKENALNSLYWDSEEMGNNNYSALIELLTEKSINQIF